MKRKIVPIVIVILLTGFIFCGCFEKETTHDNTNGIYTEHQAVRITSFKINGTEIDRENAILRLPLIDPEIDIQPINITLTVVNCLDCSMAGDAFYTGSWIIPSDLIKIDNNHYKTSWSGWDSEEIIWEAYIAEGLYYGNLSCDKRIDVVDLIIYSGDIENSDITTLSITNVTFDSYPHDFSTNAISVCADIKSNVTVTKVELFSFEITRSVDCGGGSSMRKFHEANKSLISLKEKKGTHQWVCSINDNEVVSESDSKFYEAEVANYVFYRIFAEDEAGNIAVSPLYSFIHV